MVQKPRCPATDERLDGGKVAGTTAMLVCLCLGWANVLFAQGSGVHYLHQGVMPPGAIGSQQLQRGGPLPGFFQPVEIKAPPGALISLAASGQFIEPQRAPLRAGLLVGPVYRLRVTNIPLRVGQEVFPTVELIDRTYAPVGQERRFPIPVELTQEDLELALGGKFVTRVIYLEDPLRRLPVRTGPQMEQMWYEARPGSDPLAEADALGRPVAILRLGARLPDETQPLDAKFLYGCPPFAPYPPEPKMLLPAVPAPSEKKVVPPEVKMLPPPPQQAVPPEEAAPPQAGPPKETARRFAPAGSVLSKRH